jgi:hypothetical protein
MQLQWTMPGSHTGLRGVDISCSTMVLVLALITLAAIIWQKPPTSPVEASHADKAVALSEAARARFEAALGRIVAAHEPQFTAVADAAARSASSYGKIAGALYDHARDQIDNGKHAEARLGRDGWHARAGSHRGRRGTGRADQRQDAPYPACAESGRG